MPGFLPITELLDPLGAGEEPRKPAPQMKTTSFCTVGAYRVVADILTVDNANDEVQIITSFIGGIFSTYLQVTLSKCHSPNQMKLCIQVEH